MRQKDRVGTLQGIENLKKRIENIEKAGDGCDTVTQSFIQKAKIIFENGSASEYFSRLKEVMSQFGPLGKTTDFINRYIQAKITLICQNAASRAKVHFSSFKAKILREGSGAISRDYLEMLREGLTDLAFSLFIHEASHFLKNHREVLRTPTWYGEYIAYTDSYCVLKTWVEEACHSAMNVELFSSEYRLWFHEEDKNNSEINLFLMAWQVLSSPLMLALAAAFFLPRVSAENRRLRGEPGKLDVFSIEDRDTYEIEGFEPKWTAEFGEQAAWDKLDVTKICPPDRPVPVNVYEADQDTLIIIDTFTRLIFKNIKPENFCLAPVEEIKASLIMPEFQGIRRHSDLINCEGMWIPLLHFPQTPFINLKGYEAVDFRRFSYFPRSEETHYEHASRFRFTTKGGAFSRKFLNPSVSRFLNEHPVPVSIVDAENKLIFLNLPTYTKSSAEIPRLLFFDFPEKTLWMQAVEYQPNVLTVNAGKETVQFMNPNLNWLCSHTQPLSRVILDDVIVPAFIDCSGFAFPEEIKTERHFSEQSPHSSDCKNFQSTGAHQIFIACDHANLYFNASRATVFLRDAQWVALSIGSKPLAATIHGFVSEGEGHTIFRLTNSVKTSIKIRNEGSDLLLQIADEQTLRLINRDFFPALCDPLTQLNFFKMDDSGYLNIDCSASPYVWGNIGKPEVFKLHSYDQKTIIRWESEWTLQSGFQRTADRIDISDFFAGQNQGLIASLRPSGKDTRLTVSAHGGKYGTFIFQNVPIENFCLTPIMGRKFFTPLESSVFYDCWMDFVSLKLIPNTPFVNLTGYEAVPFSSAFYSYFDETTIRILDGKFKIAGHIRQEFFSLPMYLYLKENSITVYHVTPKTESMPLQLPRYQASAQQVPALILFDFMETNLLMVATHYEPGKMTVYTGSKSVVFLGQNLEWLCNHEQSVGITFLHKNTFPSFIDCSKLDFWFSHQGFGQARDSGQRKVQNLLSQYDSTNDVIELKSTADERPCFFNYAIVKYVAQFQFETNSPWVQLRIFRSPGNNWGLTPIPLFQGVSYSESKAELLVEGSPGMIRLWLSQNYFFLLPKDQENKISLELSVNKRSVRIASNIYFKICTLGQKPPKMNSVELGLLIGALTGIVGTFILMFVITYFLLPKSQRPMSIIEKAEDLTAELVRNDRKLFINLLIIVQGAKQAEVPLKSDIPFDILWQILRSTKGFTDTEYHDRYSIEKDPKPVDFVHTPRIGKPAPFIRFLDTKERRQSRLQAITDFWEEYERDREQEQARGKEQEQAQEPERNRAAAFASILFPVLG